MTLVWVALVVVIILIVYWNADLPSLSPRVAAAGLIDGPGEYGFDIVGESHYQGVLERLAGGRSHDGASNVCRATLICETDNRYDKSAVRVEIEGSIVGHLSRENARAYRRKLKQTGHASLPPLSCAAMIVGGWDRGGGNRGYFGVKLDLPLADEEGDRDAA